MSLRLFHFPLLAEIEPGDRICGCQRGCTRRYRSGRGLPRSSQRWLDHVDRHDMITGHDLPLGRAATLELEPNRHEAREEDANKAGA